MRLRSRPYVDAGPVAHRPTFTHTARGGRRDGYQGHRGLHRYWTPARSEHRATIVSREGRKILGTALPNDEDRLREVSQRTQGKRQVLVVVDQPISSTGPGADSGPVSHPAPAQPSRREASGQGKDWRQPLHSHQQPLDTPRRGTSPRAASTRGRQYPRPSKRRPYGFSTQPHHSNHKFITTIQAALRIPTSPSP